MRVELRMSGLVRVGGAKEQILQGVHHPQGFENVMNILQELFYRVGYQQGAEIFKGYRGEA